MNIVFKSLVTGRYPFSKTPLPQGHPYPFLLTQAVAVFKVHLFFFPTFHPFLRESKEDRSWGSVGYSCSGRACQILKLRIVLFL